MSATNTTILHNLFGGDYLPPHLSEEDTREPLFEFSIPDALTRILFDEDDGPVKIGFFLFNSDYWLALLASILVTLSIAAGVGFLLFKSVVEPKKEGTLTAYLLGWGFFLPFWAAWPFCVLRVMDLRNSLFRFLLGGIAPIICFFRTVEVMYGMCPTYITKSAGEFCFYYATLPIVKRVKQTGKDKAIGDKIRCSNSKKGNLLKTFLGHLFLTGLLQSLVTAHKHLNVFAMGDANPTFSWNPTWQLYGNNALQAMLFQMYLTTYLGALQFAFSVITGCEAEPPMDNPLLESASPTDFWGRRWNLVVHTILKNGVYKPLRIVGKVPRNLAVLATFVASGAFHEWILVMVFEPDLPLSSESGRVCSYQPTYGGCTIFFAWQAVLIGIELAFGTTTNASKKTLARAWYGLPKPVKTALVVTSGIPFAHYFLEPYVRSGCFFEHGAVGLPMLIRVQ